MLDLLKFSIAADDRTKPVFDALKGELRGVKGALASVEERAQKLGRSMRNIGAGMSAAVTAPLMLMGRDMLQLYDQQAKAEAAVEQAILSTGGAAGKTAKELADLASAMQRNSLFGDEEILKGATAQLLTFTNIAGDEFDRAQQVALDLSATLGTELRSNAIMVGKALNDPARGLTALRRVGVMFTEEQEEMIKGMVAAGDAAGAQAEMLSILEEQYGGQAAAAAKAGTGALQQLQNEVGDLKEMLGEEIAGFLPGLLERVESAVDWFGQLSPQVKENIVVFGGLAAAAGPVLGILGLATMGVTALAGAFGTLGAALMANPIIAIIALIAGGAYLIWRYWEPLTEWFTNLWDDVKDVTGQAWAWIKGKIDEYAPQWLKDAWSGLAAWFDRVWASIGVGVTIGWSYIKGLLTGEYTAAELVHAAWEGLGDWFRGLWGDVSAAFQELWGMIEAELASWPARAMEWGRQLIDNFIAGLRGGNAAAAAQAELDRALQGEFQQFTLPPPALDGTGTGAIEGYLRGIEGGGADVEAAGTALGDRLVDSVENRLGIRSPSRVFEEIGGNVMQGMANGLAQSGHLAIREMENVTQKLTGVGGAAKQINGMFASTFSSIVRGAADAGDALSRLLDRLADRILTNAFDQLFSTIGLGSFLGPLFGSADGNVFHGGQVVPFAAGGVVDGPTLFPMRGRRTGLMGEAGPEAIMPLSRGPDGRLGVRAEGTAGGSANFHFAPVIDARGADQAAVARLEAQMAQMHAGFEARVQQTLRQGRNRRVNRAWAEG